MGKVVYLRCEEEYALRVTVPAKWGSEKCVKLVRLFRDSYRAAKGKAAPTSWKLWGDRSSRLLDDEVFERLDEETVWVRDRAPVSSRAVSAYVPRILAKRFETPSLEELRIRNQEVLVERAQRILDIFGAVSEDCTVRAVRRVRRGDDERLAMQCAKIRYEAVAVNAGEYADAVCRVLNSLQMVRPCIPLRREYGKVVGSAVGKSWVLRPYMEGERCVDAELLGEALGSLHATTRDAHGHAEALVEIRPKPYAERVADEIASVDVDVDFSALTSLRQRWIHDSFGPETCRVRKGRVAIDGVENSRVGTRLEDFYTLTVKAFGGFRLDAFSVAARAYVRACDEPITLAESRALPAVLALRAAVDLKSASSESRMRRLQQALRDIREHSDALIQAALDANPKLIVGAAPVRLLPPPEEEEEKHEEEKPPPPGEKKSFWSAWKAKQTTAKRKTQVVAGTWFEDALAGATREDDEGNVSVVEPVELCRSGAKVPAKRQLAKRPRAACCVLHLERERRRVAHVNEHLTTRVPRARVVRAVDALVQGELEQARRPRITFDATRGQVACAATHLAAWRSCLDAAEQCLVVLEDDAQLAPGFLQTLAILLAEAPPFDLIYLHVPSDRRDPDASGASLLVDAYETSSLTAYVVSLNGAATLIDLLDQTGLDQPIDRFVNARALDRSIAAFVLTDPNTARSRGDPALKHHRLYLPSTIDHTPPWREPDS